MQALDEWEAREKERQDAYAGVSGGLDASANSTADAPQFVAYVPLPDQKEIEQRVSVAACHAGMRICSSVPQHAEVHRSRGLTGERVS